MDRKAEFMLYCMDSAFLSKFLFACRLGQNQNAGVALFVGVIIHAADTAGRKRAFIAAGERGVKIFGNVNIALHLALRDQTLAVAGENIRKGQLLQLAQQLNMLFNGTGLVVCQRDCRADSITGGEQFTLRAEESTGAGAVVADKNRAHTYVAEIKLLTVLERKRVVGIIAQVRVIVEAAGLGRRAELEDV